MSTELDEKDKQILSILGGDARISYSELGEKVGLSRVAVKNRMDRMEENGVIRGYHVQIDPLAAGTTAFYAYCETEPAAYEAVLLRLRQNSAVSMLMQMAGNNAIAMLCVTDQEGKLRFAREIRSNAEGITYFSTRDIWAVEKGDLFL